MNGIERQGPPRFATRSVRFWSIIVAVLLADLTSKFLAARALTPGVRWPAPEYVPTLRLAFNSNLDFGLTLFGGGRWVAALLGTIPLVAVLLLSARIPARSGQYATAFALLFGGGAGNVFERWTRGRVTDFLTMGEGTFNVADIAVAAGAALYLYVRCRDGVREEGWTWRTVAFPRVLPPRLRK
jgi:signal peptidase II